MKIYKLSQTINNGYDTYDSCIVCAENDIDAINIKPGRDNYFGDWVSDIKYITVEYLGEAKNDLPKGIILASFNAG